MEPSGEEQEEPVQATQTPTSEATVQTVAHPERPTALAFEAQDLGLSLLTPTRVVEILLTDWPRLAKSVAEKRFLGRLGLLLLLVSAVAAIPYGAVLMEGGFWRVSTLFVGSLAICFPSLFIFSAYLGCRVDFMQNLVLSLLITSVSAVFSFGFFPILWFLKETMGDAAVNETGRVTWTHISTGLLTLALIAGLAQPCRYLLEQTSLKQPSVPLALLLGWQALVVFICHRMAIALALL